MELVEIILFSLLMLSNMVVLTLLVIFLNRSKKPLQKEDMLGLIDQVERTIKQANQGINDVLLLMQKQVGQSQTEALQSQSQLRVELTQQLDLLAKSSETKLESIRQTTTNMLDKLQKDNADKLEKMRETVDEKLNKTLEDRLTQKFQLISAQFETVQKGFGEMQALVSGVDELKRALSNVKTRGTMGETQLGRILEEILAPELYLKDIPTIPGSKNRVEFAVKLPGDGSKPIFLPIDAKFPLEDYYAVLKAYDTNDKGLVETSLKVLEAKIETFAADISEKYVQVPHTTNFGILFLPMEGLYAEAIRRGLVDTLQRKYSVVLAGPTTMAALLNSLHIGFKTLAIQKKSQEVWQVLASARHQFDSFADVLVKTQERIMQAGSELDKLVGVRTRKIQTTLRNLDSLGASLQIETNPQLEDDEKKE